MSVFLIEQLNTRYSQIALSDNAITVNKTRLVNETLVKLFHTTLIDERGVQLSHTTELI